MAIYSLTSTIRTDGGRNVWFPVETDYTLEEINQILADDGCVLLTKLETDRRGDGPPKIVDRLPYLVTLAGVAAIHPSHLQFVEGRR